MTQKEGISESPSTTFRQFTWLRVYSTQQLFTGFYHLGEWPCGYCEFLASEPCKFHELPGVWSFMNFLSLKNLLLLGEYFTSEGQLRVFILHSPVHRKKFPPWSTKADSSIIYGRKQKCLEGNLMGTSQSLDKTIVVASPLGPMASSAVFAPT